MHSGMNVFSILLFFTEQFLRQNNSLINWYFAQDDGYFQKVENISLGLTRPSFCVNNGIMAMICLHQNLSYKNGMIHS